MKGLKEGELNGFDGVPEAPVPLPIETGGRGGWILFSSGFHFVDGCLRDGVRNLFMTMIDGHL